MKKIVHSLGGNLACDCCDWVGPKVRFSDVKITDICPVCMEPLLTPRQFRKVQRVNRAIAIFNFLFGWAFGTEEPPNNGVAMKLEVGDRTRIRR